MVPADIRLLQTKDLFCSSSSLNGESTPVEKIATKKPDQKDMDQYLDYPDVIYQGTTIVSGSGVGVVLATGEQTVFGRLAKDISNNDVKETNFDVGIKNISKLLLTMTAIIAPLVLIINGLTKGNWLNALLFAIATAVGLTPEMLPVIVTSNLVKGSLEMSKHGTIVKKMNSIQNFGAADLLTDLHIGGVAAVLHGLRQRLQTMAGVLPAMLGDAARHKGAGAVEAGIEGDGAGFQRRCGGDDLEDRAGLVGLVHRLVAPLDLPSPSASSPFLSLRS